MKSKYLSGIIFIAVGLGFLLDQFAVISFGKVFSTYWPMILIVMGIVGMFDRQSSSFGNLVLIALGTLFQINSLDILDINVFGLIFPTILILLGINLLFSKKKEAENAYKYGNISTDKTNVDVEGNRNINFGNDVDAFVFMSGIENSYRSQEFNGGRAIAIMGAIEIDLRGSSLKNNACELEITTIMGGIDIMVPDHWRVEISGVPILGGITNKSISNIDEDAPILRIKAFALLGGIEIK